MSLDTGEICFFDSPSNSGMRASRSSGDSCRAILASLPDRVFRVSARRADAVAAARPPHGLWPIGVLGAGLGGYRVLFGVFSTSSTALPHDRGIAFGDVGSGQRPLVGCVAQVGIAEHTFAMLPHDPSADARTRREPASLHRHAAA